MPPPSRLIHRLFQSHRHELFQNISTPASSLAQRISHRTVISRATAPTVRSFSSRLHFSRPRPQQFRPQFSSSSPTRHLNRRLNSSKSESSSSSSSSSSNPGSFSERLRKLSREYGWSALGIYLFLSALDFPFCFVAVRLLGVERIGHYEHIIVEGAKDISATVWPFGKDGVASADLAVDSSAPAPDAAGQESATYDHGVVKAEKRRSEEGASTFKPC